MEDGNACEIWLIDWERSFRQEAENDSYQVLRAHLKKLELTDEPALLLEGTILFVQTCVGYLMLDNRAVEEFLARQQYDPAGVTDAPYLVTFDIHGKAFARITTPMTFKQLDYADLYGTPWNRYERVGYNQFWISRADGQDLSLDEISALDDAVTNDLRFDYAEDEMAFWFDSDSFFGILWVSVQDVESDFYAPANDSRGWRVLW